VRGEPAGSYGPGIHVFAAFDAAAPGEGGVPGTGALRDAQVDRRGVGAAFAGHAMRAITFLEYNFSDSV